MGKEMHDIKDYLYEIQKATTKLNKTTGMNYFCYRGEDEVHPFHSLPNLFRGSNFDMYQSIGSFEKNIIEEVSTNKLTKHENNLEIAMDAQHGGFPSRLLDISFNSLVALFFAVAPHYTKPININDNEDGKVIIYAIDKMVTSNSDYINNLYEGLITGSKYNVRFDGYYHYLIDYVELNPRIKAQQGGFILFCGNQYISIPEWKQREIVIPHEAKPALRDQLKQYFDITMGSIYPEPNNKAEFLIEKSSLLVQNPNHFNNILEEINRNIKWYDNKINKLENDIKERNLLINKLEIYITEIMDTLDDYLKINRRDSETVSSNESKNQDKKIEVLIKTFNQIINKINNRYGSNILKKIDSLNS